MKNGIPPGAATAGMTMCGADRIRGSRFGQVDLADRIPRVIHFTPTMAACNLARVPELPAVAA